MEVKKIKGQLRLLPATPGTCAVCAVDHEEHLAHSLTSLFYGVRFKLKYGRDPTWADACAHLSEEQREMWKASMSDVGAAWSEPPDGVEPVADPYAVSAP